MSTYAREMEPSVAESAHDHAFKRRYVPDPSTGFERCVLRCTLCGATNESITAADELRRRALAGAKP
jgi:hypothetical protein